jgi:hypothetical protein
VEGREDDISDEGGVRNWDWREGGRGCRWEGGVRDIWTVMGRGRSAGTVICLGVGDVHTVSRIVLYCIVGLEDCRIEDCSVGI